METYLEWVGRVMLIPDIIAQHIKITLRRPNFQINYKSGRSVRVLLSEIERSKHGSWKWKTPTYANKQIVLLGVDEIESVYKLY